MCVSVFSAKLLCATRDDKKHMPNEEAHVFTEHHHNAQFNPSGRPFFAVVLSILFSSYDVESYQTFQLWRGNETRKQVCVCVKPNVCTIVDGPKKITEKTTCTHIKKGKNGDIFERLLNAL